MPTYEYRCHACQRRVSLRRQLCETTPPHCPICGGRELTRLISRVHVVKSEQDRARDVSWLDRDVAQRLRRKAQGKLHPEVGETLDWMESS